MKMKRLLTVFAFFVAISSAVASDYFFAPLGYSPKTIVTVQEDNCEDRIECPGGNSLCQVGIDHDGIPGTSPISVQLYDFSLEGTDDHPVCGDILRMP